MVSPIYMDDIIIPAKPNKINGTVVIQEWNVVSVVIVINNDTVITGVIPIMNMHSSVTIAKNVLFNNVFIIDGFSYNL